MKTILIESYEGSVIIEASMNKSQSELIELARVYFQDREGIPLTGLSNAAYFNPTQFTKKRIEMEEQGWEDHFEKYTPIIRDLGNYEYEVVYEYN